MDRFFIAVLRTGVLVVILVGLWGQILVVPTTVSHQADLYPPYAPLVVPCVAVAAVGIACVQVALVAVWKLLAMARDGVLFTQSAFRWVDTVVVTSVVATLLAFGFTVYLALTPIPPPGDGMGMIGAVVEGFACAGAGVAFTMLMTVMRSQLRKATELQAAVTEAV